MKHRIVGRRLDRTTEHRTAMLRNMVASLIDHERITTTTPKAKELKRFADKMITLAKKGTPHARRVAHREVHDVAALNKLFETLAPRFAARPGGYTRIVRVGNRAGDNADMAVIELVERTQAKAAEEPEAEEKPAKKAAPKAEKKEKAPEGGARGQKKASKKPAKEKEE